jgi:hypothetical protein
MGCRREDRRGEGRCDGGKTWWSADDGGGEGRREGGEGRDDGSWKRIGTGGWAYKSDDGDPWWKRMKWKIETDLGGEERTDMRWRPNAGDERQGMALAAGWP